MTPQNFIDPTAKIGRGSKIWHWSVILQDVVIEDNVSIGSCCEIGRGSFVGENTRIGFGSFFPPHSSIGRFVFIGPQVTCTDDKYPRVNNVDYDAQPPLIEDFASIGAGVVLLPGIRIGKGAMIGAGSIVTQNVPAGATLRGDPSRTIRLPDAN